MSNAYHATLFGTESKSISITTYLYISLLPQSLYTVPFKANLTEMSSQKIVEMGAETQKTAYEPTKDVETTFSIFHRGIGRVVYKDLKPRIQAEILVKELRCTNPYLRGKLSIRKVVVK